MAGIGRRELLVTGVAAGAFGLSGCSGDADDADDAHEDDQTDHRDETDGGSVPEDETPWSRVHLAGGAEPWSAIPISGARPDPVGGPYAVSVDDVGNLRFTSAAANTEHSRREVWVTGDPVTDVEVRTVIEPPSAMDPGLSTPQMGVALRVSDVQNGKRSAFVFDTNVFRYAYRQMWCALWEWSDSTDTSSLKISEASQQIPLYDYRLPIRRVQRFAGSPSVDALTVDPTPLPAPRFGQDDLVDVVATLDGTYAQLAGRTLSVSNTDVDGATGPLLLVENTNQFNASPGALDAGYVRYSDPSAVGVDPRSLYPIHVAVRVVGKVAQLKAWAVGTSEPSWSSPDQAVTVDFSQVTDVEAPDSGRVGLIVNHLRGAGQFVAYGDLAVTPL